MDFKEKRIRQLTGIAMRGRNISNLLESDDWKEAVEASQELMDKDMMEILDPTTTSQRYYELRAEINAFSKLLAFLDSR